MSLTFSIYNTEIEDKYIRSYPVSKQSFQFNDRDIIAATMDIVLDNTDPEVFSDLYTTGLFFGTDWYQQPVTVYDNEQQIYTWTGRLKNIKENWRNKTVTCQSTNYVRDMADTVCNHTSTSNTTPAEHIYDILIDTDMIGIPTAEINYDGFQNAINIQTDNTAYVDMRFTKEKNKKCLSVIKELCRMCQMNIYTDGNNKISLYQYEEWDGILGFNVKDKDIISKTYQHWYDQKNIYNDVIVYYDSSGTATAYPTSNAASQTNYGVRQFLVPDRNVDTTSASNNILFKNVDGAEWAGDLAITRYGTIKKKFNLSLQNSYKFLTLADQIDLSFDPLVREPAQIIKLDYDRNKERVNVECEYLNTPNQVFVRDTDPPVSPELIEALPGFNNVSVVWTINSESDFAGYYIYFTATPGEWESEYCNLGRSPINIKNPDINEDFYNMVTLYELNPGTEFFFKVTAYDTSFNESADSNVLSAIPSDEAVTQYMCQGNVYDSITLDSSNAAGGSVISGTLTYDDSTYDDGVYTYTAYFESMEYYNASGHTAVSWKANGDASDILYQYRTSADAVTWEDWSTLADAIGDKVQAVTSVYFQIRFIFYSDLWTDTDNFHIKEVI